MRLQKYLAHAGVAARRKAEELIVDGHVSVNGRIMRALGTTVDAGDRVAVDGRVVAPPAEHRYVVLHKPVKVMTTMRDPERRRTVASLLPRDAGRVVPVGRLDYDTAGVLLMTDDGDLAHVLAHPRFGVEKTYRAIVGGRMQPNEVAALLAGIRLDEGRTGPAKVRVVKVGSRASELDITIHEGKYRQVRRMLEAAGHPVVSLVRLRFGPIALGELKVGEWRAASAREVAALRRIERAAREDGGDAE